ncbi:MAG TPA: hypothetical protein VKQ32_04975 [Polyangia bacterium]|nr:hypothetical protein [Polyangia bacterium]
MSDDSRKSEATASPADEVASVPRGYEPPKLTHVGNARDLLAGSNGTQVDVSPIGNRVKQP